MRYEKLISFIDSSEQQMVGIIAIPEMKLKLHYLRAKWKVLPINLSLLVYCEKPMNYNTATQDTRNGNNSVSKLVAGCLAGCKRKCGRAETIN